MELFSFEGWWMKLKDRVPDKGAKYLQALVKARKGPNVRRSIYCSFLPSVFQLDPISEVLKIWPWLQISFFFFFVFLGPHMAYGGSQARGLIGAVAAGLHHSHSNTRSEPHLQTYTTGHSSAGSSTNWARPGIKPATPWFLLRFISAVPWNS